MDELVALLILACTASICWDVFRYEARQDKWEKEHPGQRYIRNYRKLTGDR